MNPRTEGKFKSDYKLKDVYSIYLENNYEGLQVDYITFSKVIKDFNLLLTDFIIYNPEGIKLPLNLGYVRIRKSKVNLARRDKLIPDWKATNDLWDSNPSAKEKKTLMFHLNEHRDGYKYKIFWDKSIARIKNKSFYFYIPARAFKRKLAHILKTNSEIDYYL